jgi:Spy/CpxP family protein refolding chaperone
MKNRLSRFLLGSAFAASLAFAQPPAGHTPPDPAMLAQRRVNFLTRQLTLTPAQQQQATTIFTNEITNTAAIRTNLNTAHQALTTAVTNNDAGGMSQESTTIGNLTAQLTLADAQANAAFYQTLTPDQQTKYTAMTGRGPMGGGGGPAGGFGGRRGPGQ